MSNFQQAPVCTNGACARAIAQTHVANAIKTSTKETSTTRTRAAGRSDNRSQLQPLTPTGGFRAKPGEARRLPVELDREVLSDHVIVREQDDQVDLKLDLKKPFQRSK